MTSEQPKVKPDGLYGLVETAKALGVSQTTITRAANATGRRAIPCKIRRSTGHRVFKGQDIINYWRQTI